MLDTISESRHGDFDIEVLQQNFLLTIKKKNLEGSCLNFWSGPIHRPYSGRVRIWGKVGQCMVLTSALFLSVVGINKCKHYILLVLLTQHLVYYHYIAGASVTIVTLWQMRWRR